MKNSTSVFLGLMVLLLSVSSCKKGNTSLSETGNSTLNDTIATATPENAAAVPSSDAAPLTTLALSENSFDFGNLKKGEKKSHTYEFTNTGTNPLIISEVKPGCGCTASEYTQEPILPGKKGTVTLNFDSTNFDGTVQKYADVFVNVEKSPIKLTFTANIQP